MILTHHRIYFIHFNSSVSWYLSQKYLTKTSTVRKFKMLFCPLNVTTVLAVSSWTDRRKCLEFIQIVHNTFELQHRRQPTNVYDTIIGKRNKIIFPDDTCERYNGKWKMFRRFRLFYLAFVLCIRAIRMIVCWWMAFFHFRGLRSNVYRIGCDDFMAICYNISNKTVKRAHTHTQPHKSTLKANGKCRWWVCRRCCEQKSTFSPSRYVPLVALNRFFRALEQKGNNEMRNKAFQINRMYRVFMYLYLLDKTRNIVIYSGVGDRRHAHFHGLDFPYTNCTQQRLDSSEMLTIKGEAIHDDRNRTLVSSPTHRTKIPCENGIFIENPNNLISNKRHIYKMIPSIQQNIPCIRTHWNIQSIHFDE